MHTPTPWKSRGMGGDSIVLAEEHRWHRPYGQNMGYPIAVPRVADRGDGERLIDGAAGFAHEDARRIVACVNAFHGSDIPTEKIGVGMVRKLLKRIIDLEAEACLENCSDCGKPENCPSFVAAEKDWAKTVEGILTEIGHD